MKKRFLILLSIMIIFLLPLSAYAADPDEIPGNELETAESGSSAFPSDGPDISGTSAIVMDIDTGDILYRMNPHQKAEPASTTKLMTALIAVEKLAPEDEIEVTRSIYSNLIEDAVTIGLIPGEKITTRDMLYGMLLPSANDAANALGEGAAGTIRAFVDLMNEKAAALGCRDTHFANTNGLHDDNHYTTVYDMALIACEAYRSARIREVIATPSYWMAATNLSDKRELWTTNELLYDVTDLYYEYCTGGKTGYIGEAGYTMVSFAEKDGRRIVSVVFGCPTSVQRFQDAAALLDYGLKEYHILQPLKGFDINTENSITNPIGENFYTSLSHALPSYTVDDSLRFYTRSSVTGDDIIKNIQLNGSIVNGVVGTVKLSYKGKSLAEVPIKLDTSQLGPGNNSMIMSLDGTYATEDTTPAGQSKDSILGDTLKTHGVAILLAILAALAVLFLFLMLRKYQAKKRVRIKRYMGDRPRTAPVKKQQRSAFYDDEDTPPARPVKREPRQSDGQRVRQHEGQKERQQERQNVRRRTTGSGTVGESPQYRNKTERTGTTRTRTDGTTPGTTRTRTDRTTPGTARTRTDRTTSGRRPDEQRRVNRDRGNTGKE